MSMINPSLVEENKQKLVAEKAHLEKLLSRVAEKGKDGGDFRPKFPNIGDDEGDSAIEVEQFEVNLAEEGDLEQKLVKVNAALGRIEDGKYGMCAVGGEELAEERLRVVPEADTCVAHEAR